MVTQEERPKSRMAERLAQRREAYEQRGVLYKVLFVSAGAVVTLAGIAMLALPGPALVVIPIGLAMLAMQFAWAEHALEKALDKADQAQRAALDASPAKKILSGIAIALAAAAFVVCAILYDIPVLPV